MGQLPQKKKNEAPAAAVARAAAVDHGVRHLPLQEVVGLTRLLLLLDVRLLLLLGPLLLPLLLLLLLRQLRLCCHCACLWQWRLLLIKRWRWGARRWRRKKKELQSGQEGGEESSKKVGQVQVKSGWIPERNNQWRRRRWWLSLRTLRIWWLF